MASSYRVNAAAAADLHAKPQCDPLNLAVKKIAVTGITPQLLSMPVPL